MSSKVVRIEITYDLVYFWEEGQEREQEIYKRYNEHDWEVLSLVGDGWLPVHCAEAKDLEAAYQEIINNKEEVY